MRLIRNFDIAAAHCAARIEGCDVPDFWPGEGLLILHGNEIMAAAVYHGYRPKNGTIEMSIAADTPRWATRGAIRALLWYPFGQLQCEKVIAMALAENARSLKLVQGLGFEREGWLRRHARGRDVVVNSMFRETWLERWADGQQQIRAKAA